MASAKAFLEDFLHDQMHGDPPFRQLNTKCIAQLLIRQNGVARTTSRKSIFRARNWNASRKPPSGTPGGGPSEDLLRKCKPGDMPPASHVIQAVGGTILTLCTASWIDIRLNRQCG